MTTTKKDKKKAAPAPESQEKPEASYEFRFLKLTNGEEILCQVPSMEIQDMFFVRFPLKISTMFDASLDEAVYVFTPWIPFTNQELISINKLTVVTITTVRDNVKEIYLQKIAAYQRAAAMQQVNVTLEDDSTPEPPPITQEFEAAEDFNEDLTAEQKEALRRKKKAYLN